MPIYNYKAKKGPKEIVEGEIEAVSQDEAVARLEEMKMVPISVSIKGAAPAQPAATTRRESVKEPESAPSLLTGVRVKDIDTFTRQLASLIKASVPVLRALTLISEQTESGALKAVVSDLAKQVKEGKMLSEAMEGYGKFFNNLYINMLKSGEKTGAIDSVLAGLADYREKEQEIRRRVQSAMAYPVLMIMVGIGTVFVMFTYFMPKLIGLFENMKQALPLPTRILIGISDFMSGNWYWILAGLVITGVVIGRSKAGGKKKFLFDTLKLQMPVVKDFVKNAEIARFTKTLKLLLGSGIAMHESLELAGNTLNNDALKAKLGGVSQEIVSQGASLSDSLKRVDVFPQFAINMIAVGEEGGKLEDSLGDISLTYERELEQAIKIATSLLEPALILIVGGLVGFIVFAMLLPIFDIGMMGQ